MVESSSLSRGATHRKTWRQRGVITLQYTRNNSSETCGSLGIINRLLNVLKKERNSQGKDR